MKKLMLMLTVAMPLSWSLAAMSQEPAAAPAADAPKTDAPKADAPKGDKGPVKPKPHPKPKTPKTTKTDAPKTEDAK
jgi:hypothetical protein